MGYSETTCQLCGVSFAIARIRTINEPHESAWAYHGKGFVEDEDHEFFGGSCGKEGGCQIVDRPGAFGDDNDSVIAHEHVAGPGCTRGTGYNGNMISVAEMKGCRIVQCLASKNIVSWTPELDDEDFEVSSNYFLTGLGEGSPDTAPLEDISPARHGLSSLLISNVEYDEDEWGLPFHPTCFEIFKRISRDRSGRVDINGLWAWRKIIDKDYEDLFEKFPRAQAVTNGFQQWWQHELGNEYLAANPVEVPGLLQVLKSCHHEWSYIFPGMEKVPYDVNLGVYSWRYKGPDDTHEKTYRVPPESKVQSGDSFQKLPAEILFMIWDELSSKDIANLRCVTRSCRQLPTILFRKRLLADMPWFWEARDMELNKTDWYRLYTMLKGCWQDLKGLKNRQRIWKDVNEIMDRIEKGREDGRIID